MSMLLMVEAMKAKVGSSGRKLVLLKLADNANDKGECWPSYQHIADQCEMGRSTVKAHIKTLEEDGFLSIAERNGGASSNKFKLHISAGKASEKETVTESDSNPVENEPGQILTPTRSDLDPPTRSDLDPRTYHSFEPVKEPKKQKPRAKRSCVNDPVMQERFAKFWAAYPKRVSKGQAETTFAKINPDDLLLTRMLKAIKKQTEHRAMLQQAGQWVANWKNPSTWLNAKSWDDELEAIEPETGTKKTGTGKVLEGVFYI